MQDSALRVIVEVNLIALCEFYVNNEIRVYIVYLKHANVKRKSLSTASVARENLLSFVLSFARKSSKNKQYVFLPFQIPQRTAKTISGPRMVRYTAQITRGEKNFLLRESKRR